MTRIAISAEKCPTDFRNKRNGRENLIRKLEKGELLSTFRFAEQCLRKHLEVHLSRKKSGGAAQRRSVSFVSFGSLCTQSYPSNATRCLTSAIDAIGVALSDFKLPTGQPHHFAHITCLQAACHPHQLIADGTRNPKLTVGNESASDPS